MFNHTFRYLLGAAVAVVAAVLTSCGNDGNDTGWEYAPNMYHAIAPNGFQYTVREDGTHKNPIFKDGMNAQKAVKGTMPRAESWMVGGAYTAYAIPNTPEGYELANSTVKMPEAIAKDSVKAAKEGEVLFTRFCAVCHGAGGNGQGTIIAQGAYPQLPPYVIGFKGDDTGLISEGRMFHTMTYGKNNMGSYASQVTPEERWKIISYLKKIQKP